eukprot:1070265-Rhodomonas_salina.2
MNWLITPHRVGCSGSSEDRDRARKQRSACQALAWRLEAPTPVCQCQRASVGGPLELDQVEAMRIRSESGWRGCGRLGWRRPRARALARTAPPPVRPDSGTAHSARGSPP